MIWHVSFSIRLIQFEPLLMSQLGSETFLRAFFRVLCVERVIFGVLISIFPLELVPQGTTGFKLIKKIISHIFFYGKYLVC